MRKFAKLSFIVLVPFLIGTGLQSIGYNVGNAALEYAGEIISFIGTVLTAIGLVAAGIVMMILGKLRFDWDFNYGEESCDSGTPIDEIEFDEKPAKRAEQTALEKEDTTIEVINQSEGYESQFKQADFIAGHSANAYSNSTKKQKVLGWIYFAFLLITFTLIPCLAFFKLYLGTYICLGIFGGTVIISIIIKVIAVHRSRRMRWRRPDKVVRAQGVVASCVLSSVSSTGGGNNYSPIGITNVTYKVTVVVNGREYEAYTSRTFERGDVIAVLIDARGKSKIAHIF